MRLFYVVAITPCNIIIEIWDANFFVLLFNQDVGHATCCFLRVYLLFEIVDACQYS